MARKDDHDKKDDFNYYRDFLHIKDYDHNGEIDWRDEYYRREYVYGGKKKREEKEREDYYYFNADDDDFEVLDEDCDVDEDSIDEDYQEIDYEEGDLEDELCDDFSLDFDNSQEDDISIDLSFNHQESKKTSNGVWRYYDEWNDWMYAQALIDNFSELEEDYEANSDSTLTEIILETYEIDKDRAISYLKWLWKTFTPDLFIGEKDTPWGTESFKGRGEIIKRLILENFSCDYLYNLLKNDTDFLIAGFIDCRHEKHDLRFVKEYMYFMLIRLDVDAMIDAYNYYLKGQKGRYTDKDLGKMWDSIAFRLYYSELDEQEKLDMLERFIPYIECLGVRSKKPLDNIAQYQKELKTRLDGCYTYDEDEYEDEYYEDETEEDDDDYAEVVPIQNTYNYTADFTQDSTIYDFCQVSFVKFKKKGLYYFTNGIDVHVGDEVVAPYGGDNLQEPAIVISVGKGYADAFGFDITRMKNIIRKIDK